jgi:colanic acid/amylovoran biosynthesis protein
VTNILVTNLHSSRNAGDAALTLSALQQLRQNFPNSRITLSMYDPASHSGPEPAISAFMTWTLDISTERGGRWKLLTMGRLLAASLTAKMSKPMAGQSSNDVSPSLRITPAYTELLGAFQAADLVISAPGNFLYSSGKFGLTLLHHLYTLWYATWLGKPLYIFPQSIGPFQRGWEAALVRAVLKRARIVMVREQVSLDQLTKQGFNHPRLTLVPDLAFAFQGAASIEAQAWLTRWGVDLQTDRPRLGLTAINWELQNPKFTHQADYELALARAAEGFIQHTGGQVVLFAQVCGQNLAADDRIPARRVAERLRERGQRVVQIDEPAPAELLRTAYSFMDIFIGTRMHSNIFALAGGVPVLAIAYRYKTRGLMETLGLSEWVLEIEQVDGDLLLERLLALWEAQAALRQQIQPRVAELAAGALRAGKWVAEDYAVWQAKHGNNRYSQGRDTR